MPIFMIVQKTFRYPTRDDQQEGVAVLSPGDLFTGDAAGRFIEGSDPAVPGFVLTTRALSVPSKIAPITTPEAKTDFCEIATIQSRVEKTDRNYLLAVAYYLSKNLGEFGKPDDARVGPFQFSLEEWRNGIAMAKAKGQDYWMAHIFEPMLQIHIAAIRSAKAIEDFKTTHNGKLPMPLELFLFERLQERAMPLLALAADPNKTCKDAIDFPAPANSYAEKIKNAGNKKLGDFLSEVRAGLASGFSASRADVNRLPPHLQFFTEEDRAPWLAVARMLSGKNLQTSADKLPAQFMSVVNMLHPPRSPVFVGFCLTFSGVAAAQNSVPDDVASPNGWKQWQKEAPDPIPAGAIVVTKSAGGVAANVGILASAPSGNTLQVYFASDGAGVVDIETKPIANDQVDGKLRWLELAGSVGVGGPAAGLGSLSEKYESGGRGPAVISSGKDDAGGVSYGTYQLSSVTGSAAAFVQSLPADLKARFAGTTPGQQDFSAVWQAIAAEDAGRFGKLQHDYIKAEYYDRLVAKVRTDLNFDVNTRSAALQNCCWSTAVQHGAGGGTSIVELVIGPLMAGGTPLADIKAFDEQALRKIYEERGRKNDNGTLKYFSNNPQATQDSVAQRFQNELADALKMLAA